jgi:hypothetical protein
MPGRSGVVRHPALVITPVSLNSLEIGRAAGLSGWREVKKAGCRDHVRLVKVALVVFAAAARPEAEALP